MIVPNQFPTTPSDLKLALVGEAPGADEDRLGQPFMGRSGQLLNKLLARAGIQREACFVGNLCQHRPPGGKNVFELIPPDQLESGKNQLMVDLTWFNPNIVVLLGGHALKWAKGEGKFSITNWRGSVFFSDLLKRKCIASYHPAFCERDWTQTPWLQMDLRKAVTQAAFPDFRFIPREYVIPREAFHAIDELEKIRAARVKTAFDIEGSYDSLTCIGFANDIRRAVIIPFLRMNGTRYWQDPKDEIQVLLAVDRLLSDSSVPKVVQAGLYDRFCLQYGYGILPRGQFDDTMVKHWALYSELARDVEKKKGRKGMGLAVQLSLYTDIPYYKDERKIEDDDTHYSYCGKDCVGTLEVDQVLTQIFSGPGSKSHFTKEELTSMMKQYDFNMELQYPLLWMEQRGMKYDVEKAKERRDLLRTKLFEAQARLNYITNHGFSWKSHQEIQARVQELMLTKKGDRPYKDYEEAYKRVRLLVEEGTPTLSTIGEIEDLCEVSLNTDSTKQFLPFLYETLKLPVQYSDDKENPHPTGNYEALLKLSRHCLQQDEPFLHSILQTAIEIRALSTRQQMLSISADPDGRIRCAYNNVGSNTGRITCYESPTGSGYNLQTIPNYTDPKEAPGAVLGDRDLFLSDPDHWFFQCDLAGADGWTVAAYSAMLGDSTMLLDYLAGVRPFEVLVLMLNGWAIPGDRGELKATCKEKVKKDSWERFAMKRVQHGGSYLEGDLTISRNILKDSEGKLYIAPVECGKMKKYFFNRYYGIPRYHDWVARRIRERPVLTAASGQVRQFFGRADEILTKAVAFEPQANTTYATNMAMYNLWTDEENRMQSLRGKLYGEKGAHNDSMAGVTDRREISLRIQPLHQVHDALCGQFLKSDTPWAIGKLNEWFANDIKIANQMIRIPFDGAYGRAWGDLSEGKI